MSTIGGYMIVKNEANVIERALSTMLPLSDFILVEDTGSTDGTQQIVTDFLGKHGVPGAVIEEPWQNFAYNRTHALDALRTKGVDFALRLDADDVFEYAPWFYPGLFKKALTADIYDITVNFDSISFTRPDLHRADLRASYKGVVHEYLNIEGDDLLRMSVEGLSIKVGGDGARRRSGHKYLDDIALLEEALRTETDPFLVSRYTFYLAQSYRDAGMKANALFKYLQRAAQGGWVEEQYISFYEAGNLMWHLGFAASQVLSTYGRATDLIPTRAEALKAAAAYCEGRRAPLTQPVGLFVQPRAYGGGNACTCD